MKGKAKEDFEKWFNQKVKFDIELNGDYYPESWLNFYSLPESMQWGVIVDFFDSVGINIEIWKTDEPHFRWVYWIGKHNQLLETRQEARTKAIEKATEIYNNR